jgi:hypothetical protein
MPISANEVAVGRCYSTALNQVRRVLKIENDEVTFEERSGTEFAGSSLMRTTVGIARFVHEVDRQVPCN